MKHRILLALLLTALVASAAIGAETKRLPRVLLIGEAMGKAMVKLLDGGK